MSEQRPVTISERVLIDMQVPSEPIKMVIVLPVYNEADSITAVLGEVHETAVRLSLSGVRTSVIVVDDDSPDGTGEVALAFAKDIALDLTVVRGVRAGLGAAMLRGLAAALEFDPDEIVTFDGDGQHNPFDVPTLHRAFAARKADIVIGSRWTRGGRAPGTSIGRMWGSRIGNVVFRLVTGTRGVADATTSFRVYSPRVVRYLLSTNSARYSGYSFFSTTIALAEAAGYTITEVPIEFRPRYGGQSKLNRREVFRYFKSLPSLRSERRRSFDGQNEAYLATDEIEWLDKAVAWNRFVVDATLKGVTTPVRRVVEVGAGVGAVTEELVQRFQAADIVAYEPDADNFERLAHRFAARPQVEPISGVLPAEGTADADLIVYINVLEHIADDVEELRRASTRLLPGGQLAIFVPALDKLYGPIDARSGHFRRYSSAMLVEHVEAAGLTVERVRYVDRLGVFPYWLSFRFLNKAGVPLKSITLFERVFVPGTRLADRVIGDRGPGKNLVCVARLT
jgi:dolichol-phosphate mannosyltransferase